MGEKEGKGEKDKKKEGGGAEKKDAGPIEIVLKVDMHCEGCAAKIKRSVKGLEGVESATTDMASNKLTVKGKVDPWMIRDRVETKTKKKVEIISPANLPKKDPVSGDKKPAAVSTGDKKPADAAEKSNDKKSKEPAAPAVSSVVLKIRLHCDGCIQRIKKTLVKLKGVKDVIVDAQKDLVTVKGTMDVNSLPSYLKDKLNRSVEIVPGAAAGGDKKDKAGGGGGGGAEKKDGGGGGGEKKEGGGGGGEKKVKAGGGNGGEKKEGGGGGGGDKKVKEGGGGGEGGGKKEEAAKAVAVETNKMEYYGSYGYGAEMLHAPQLFSDENPNACSVM